MINHFLTGSVFRLQIFTEKGKPAEKTETVVLQEGLGILGDRHSDGRERQISILLAEIGEWMEAQEDKGLCFERYKENIRIAGLPIGQVFGGMRLRIGEAELEILENRKKCYHECFYIQNKKACFLSVGIFYARVVRSGKISINDSVICIQKNA